MVQEFGRSDLREFIHSGYRIVYLVRESDVVVVSVFEGHRGLRLTEADMRTADE
jgi:plasmid stabilization system protein ParE